MLPIGTVITIRIPKDSEIPYVEWFVKMSKSDECLRIINHRDSAYKVETLSNNSISPYSQFNIREEIASPVEIFKKF